MFGWKIVFRHVEGYRETWNRSVWNAMLMC